MADSRGVGSSKNLGARHKSAATILNASGFPSDSHSTSLRHCSTFVGSESNAAALSAKLSSKALDGNSSTAKVFSSPVSPNRTSQACSATSATSPSHFTRALQLHDQCEQELQQLCERKYAHRRYIARAAASRKSDQEAMILHEKKAPLLQLDKEAYDALIRKLSPTMKNTATTHADLLHTLQSCTECNARASFCRRCAEKATEFFQGFTHNELLAAYGQDLPEPNAQELELFGELLNYRLAMAVGPTSCSIPSPKSGTSFRFS